MLLPRHKARAGARWKAVQMTIGTLATREHQTQEGHKDIPPWFICGAILRVQRKSPASRRDPALGSPKSSEPASPLPFFCLFTLLIMNLCQACLKQEVVQLQGQRIQGLRLRAPCSTEENLDPVLTTQADHACWQVRGPAWTKPEEQA